MLLATFPPSKYSLDKPNYALLIVLIAEEHFSSKTLLYNCILSPPLYFL